MDEQITKPGGLNYAEFDKLRRTLNDTARHRGSALGTTTFNDQLVRMFPVHGAGHRLCGQLSDAMTGYAFGVRPRPSTPGTPNCPGGLGFTGVECGRDYPHDADDLGACHETLRLAIALNATGITELAIPADVVDRMHEVYEEFWLWVVAGVNRYGVHIRDTEWHKLPAPATA